MHKIYRVVGCPICPHHFMEGNARRCALSNKVIWADGYGTSLMQFPDWCELEDILAKKAKKHANVREVGETY